MIFEKDDLKLHYECRGEGQPFLMLHGMPTDRRAMIGAFEPVFQMKTPPMTRFQPHGDWDKSYQRYYVDLPGMGKTTGGSWIKSNDDVVKVLAEFVESVIGKRPFLLAGFSYGGYIARGLLHHFSHQVDGIVLIAPVVLGERENRTLPEPRVIAANPEGLKQFPEPLGEFLSTMLVAQEEAILTRQHEVLDGIQVADHKKVAEISEKYPFSFPVDQLPAPFEKPVLIVTGRHDHVTGYADPFQLVDHFPRATYIVLDRAGHGVHIEQPHLFNALVFEWLARVEEEKQRSALKE